MIWGKRIGGARRWLAIAVLLSAFLPTWAEAAHIAVRLIHATNPPPPAPEAKQAAQPQQRLEKAFGWREYKVLSTSETRLQEGQIQQITLGHDLTLRLKILKTQGPSHFMKCELLQGDKELVQTTVTARSGSSYFITGPWYGEGQLLISVAVR